MKPLVVGLGGTLRQGSTSEKALRIALVAAEKLGARTELLCGRNLEIAMYDPDERDRTPAVARLVTAIRSADGMIVSTPAYHGGLSGLIKNALDYAEDTIDDRHPYLDGRAVGLIVTANGIQAMGTTLSALRSVVHSLRGWPTPLAVTINSNEKPFGNSAKPDRLIENQLHMVAEQVVSFARWQMAGSNNIRPVPEPVFD